MTKFLLLVSGAIMIPSFVIGFVWFSISAGFHGGEKFVLKLVDKFENK